MAGMAANSPTLLPAHWSPGRKHRQSPLALGNLRIVACYGQSESPNRFAVARDQDIAPKSVDGGEKETTPGGGLDGEKDENPGEEDQNGKLERGPSVEEAKIMARHRGQVEAFSAPYRTKRWALTRGKGAAIGDLMIMYGGLLDRGFGSGQIIAASGAVVIAKVRKDAKKLMGEEGVRDLDILELLRAMELLEAELKLVRAADKGEALFQRLEEAKKHCKLAFAIANRI